MSLSFAEKELDRRKPFFRFRLFVCAPFWSEGLAVRIAKVVRSVPFANVVRGGIVRFFANGKLCTGMKVCGAQGNAAMLFLTSHVSYPLGSVIFPATDALTPWHPDLMLEFLDAVLVIKDFSHLHAATDNPPKVNSLTLHVDGRSMFLSKSRDVSPQYIDMESDELFPPSYRRPIPSIIVFKWAILAGDTKTTLVEFPENSSLHP